MSLDFFDGVLSLDFFVIRFGTARANNIVIRGIGDTHGWVVDHAMTTSGSMANYADNWETARTMGNQDFTVCQRHMAKLRRHMAKSSPTVAAGKPQTAATGMAKDEFAVCHFSHTQSTSNRSHDHKQLCHTIDNEQLIPTTIAYT